MHGPLPDIHYRAAVQARSLQPGAHGSHVVGPGLEPTGSVPLARARDLRRLDLHTSLRDPFGQLWVRQFRQRSALRVWWVVDQSASMQRWREPLVQLAQALAQSAQRRGDAFGLWAFAHDADVERALMPTRSRQAAAAALAGWAAAPWAGPGARGLATLAAQLPPQPALVLLVSDFLAPPAQWDEALAPLARHDVLPVWLDHPAADAALPRWGLAPLRDAETGQRRLLWLRPGLVRRWQAQRAAHRQAVHEVLARHQRVPVHLGPRLDADDFNRQLAQRGA